MLSCLWYVLFLFTSASSSFMASLSSWEMNVVNNCSDLDVPLFHVESRTGGTEWSQTQSVFSHVFFFLTSFFFSFCSIFLCKILPVYTHPNCFSPVSFVSSTFLCALSLSPLLPPLCMLWYADMQEFLGLKMIDQTCQPWLLLLKMAALAVCVPVIGACRNYLPYDWAPLVCLRLTCCWQKCEFQCFVCVGTWFYV